jgi:hypothetical protein
LGTIFFFRPGNVIAKEDADALIAAAQRIINFLNDK